MEPLRFTESARPRFYHVRQLLNWENDIGPYEAKHAAILFTAEAMATYPNLKFFLTKVVLFGNHGYLNPQQVKIIASELFSLQSAENGYLKMLQESNRLGYTETEIEQIVALTNMRNSNGTEIMTALGYVSPYRSCFS